MFSRILTQKSTAVWSDQIERLKLAIEECDAVVIGAGAGLSTSAGLTYSGERFEKTSGILRRSMESGICTPGGSIPLNHWRNIGHGGAAISW